MVEKDRVLLVHEISDELRLVVTLGAYRGQLRLDARQHWRDGDGEWHPTRRGVAIPAAILPQFHEAVGRALAEARAESGG